jgi:hypothetical protein
MRSLVGMVAVLLVAAGCGSGGGNGDGGSDGGVDAFADPYGTCKGRALTSGVSWPTVGEYYNCSTWEHDHCCACAVVNGRQEWVCAGPHASCSSSPVVPDAGVVEWMSGGGCLVAPIYGEACSPTSPNKAFTCTAWTGDLCCRCGELDGGSDGHRWRCDTTSPCI